MTRFTSALNEAEASKQSVRMTVFAELQIPGSPDPTTRVHDGLGTITWGGYNWYGIGAFGSVSQVQENLEPLAMPVDLTLSGVDPALISDAMTTQYHGQPAILYIGFIDTATGALVDTPEAIWDGLMDVMTIDVSQGSATITVRCEHSLRRNPSPARYTTEDLQLIHPGDTFFWSLHTVNRRSLWGSVPTPKYDNPPVPSDGGGTRPRWEP